MITREVVGADHRRRSRYEEISQAAAAPTMLRIPQATVLVERPMSEVWKAAQ